MRLRVTWLATFISLALCVFCIFQIFYAKKPTYYFYNQKRTYLYMKEKTQVKDK